MYDILYYALSVDDFFQCVYRCVCAFAAHRTKPVCQLLSVRGYNNKV